MSCTFSSVFQDTTSLRSGRGLKLRSCAKADAPKARREKRARIRMGASVLVSQAAVFADSEPFAILPELLQAVLLGLSGLQAPGGRLVGGSHGAVAADVLLALLVAVRLRKHRAGEAHSQHDE